MIKKKRASLIMCKIQLVIQKSKVQKEVLFTYSWPPFIGTGMLFLRHDGYIVILRQSFFDVIWLGHEQFATMTSRSWTTCHHVFMGEQFVMMTLCVANDLMFVIHFVNIDNTFGFPVPFAFPTAFVFACLINKKLIYANLCIVPSLTFFAMGQDMILTTFSALII